jgi:hypothetical protein
MDNAILVSEWDPEVFHQRVLKLEAEGYVSRRETYRITAEMNPNSGRVTHLYSIEMQKAVALDNHAE